MNSLLMESINLDCGRPLGLFACTVMLSTRCNWALSLFIYFNDLYVGLYSSSITGQAFTGAHGSVQSLSLSKGSESTTGYTFAPCVGSFTSPGIDTR